MRKSKKLKLGRESLYNLSPEGAQAAQGGATAVSCGATCSCGASCYCSAVCTGACSNGCPGSNNCTTGSAGCNEN